MLYACIDGCGAELRSPGKQCAFCLGKSLERQKDFLAAHAPRCAMCKNPVDTESEKLSAKAMWKSRGKLTAHWLHRGACYELASKKVSFVTLRAHELRRVLNQDRRQVNWLEKGQRDKAMAKASARDMGRTPRFFAYPPKAPGGVGTFVVGKILSATVKGPTADRNFEKGTVALASRVLLKGGEGAEDRFVEVEVSWDDLTVAKFFASRLESKGPTNPGLRGQWVAIVYPAKLHIRGDKSYHNPEVFYSSDLKELLAEVNADPIMDAIREREGWSGYEVDYQTWFDGVELRFAEFMKERGADMDGNIPF